MVWPYLFMYFPQLALRIDGTDYAMDRL